MYVMPRVEQSVSFFYYGEKEGNARIGKRIHRFFICIEIALKSITSRAWWPNHEDAPSTLSSFRRSITLQRNRA